MQTLCNVPNLANLSVTEPETNSIITENERMELLKREFPKSSKDEIEQFAHFFTACNSKEEIEETYSAHREEILVIMRQQWEITEKKKKLAEETKRRSDLIKSAKIPKIFNAARAVNFIITDKNEFTAKTAIKSITNNDGLYIYGECGTGKTMLASIIANERAELFKPSMFISAVDIFQELNPYSSDSKTAAYRKSVIKNTPCLIIDDLGAEKPSDWTKQTMFELIDFRYREKLQTIITSNFNINELASRLSEYEGKRIIRRIKVICNLVELNHF